MTNNNNLYLSSNIILKYNKILYISILNLYGINKYKTNIITTIFNTSYYKLYNNFKYLNHICFKQLFEYTTFNINSFKKKSNLYNNIKHKKLNK